MRKLDATKLITSGHSTRLECNATGSPVITFKWFKDEMEISSGPKYTMSSSDFVASLEVAGCAVEDSGDYVCVASSEAGSDRCSCMLTVKGWFFFIFWLCHLTAEVEARNFFRLQSNILATAIFNLLEPPTFVRCLESKDVVKGTELMIESQVSGSSPFAVIMYKNGKPIRNDKKHRITLKEEHIALQVLLVGQGDVGTYQCTVENEVGVVSCDCQVTLKGLY